MKKLMLLLLCLIGSIPLAGLGASGDLRGVTADGRKVILMTDGTWRFDDKPVPLVAGPGEGSPYQPSVKKFSVAFDPQKWTSTSDKDGGTSKRVFKHKQFPIYALVISDEIPATNDMLKRVITYNAKKAGMEPTIVVDETRKIDGKEVGVISFIAASEGLEFMYKGNYYGDDSGNIQITCFTASQLFHKYQSECDEFLNGFHIK